MRTVNMHEAKTHLSKLVQGAVDAIVGLEPFLTVTQDLMGDKAVMLTRLGRYVQGGGFFSGGFTAGVGVSGEFVVPQDIKSPYREEIERMFYGDEGFLLDKSTEDNLI